jgi:hypothetical protein
MTLTKRIVSALLFVWGAALVLAGISVAQDFTVIGIVASFVAIATLLYSGAVWSGRFEPPPHAATPEVVVFDRAFRIVSGRNLGRLLAVQFPETAHKDLLERCMAVLDGGANTPFVCETGAGVRVFEIVPVRTADGTIAYGMIFSSSAAVSAREDRLTTVA